jgi:hypothetical protein
MPRTKYVTIESYGPIQQLFGLLGPILTPCYIEIGTIISLVNSGKVVYEVNPNNPKEKIRLNFNNLLKNNFDNIIEETKVVAPSKKRVTQPVKKQCIEKQKTDSVLQKEQKPEKVKEIQNNKLDIDLFISNKYS